MGGGEVSPLFPSVHWGWGFNALSYKRFRSWLSRITSKVAGEGLSIEGMGNNRENNK